MTTQAPALAPIEPSTLNKVFVGNLNFKTTPSDLGKLFATVGDVVSANIICRGPYSMGYGFVEMKTEADAKKAVETMDKKELDGRNINVELAKPRTERGPRTSRPYRGRFPRRGFYGGAGGFTPATTEGAFFGNAGGFGSGGYGYPPRRGFRRGFRRGRRFPRRNMENVPISKTRIYLSNIPYALTEDDLKALFPVPEFNVKSANIPLFAGRSRGFGFIEFATEVEQQKAVAMNTKTVSGREVVIRPAREPPTPETAPAPSTTTA